MENPLIKFIMRSAKVENAERNSMINTINSCQSTQELTEKGAGICHYLEVANNSNADQLIKSVYTTKQKLLKKQNESTK